MSDCKGNTDSLARTRERKAATILERTMNEQNAYLINGNVGVRGASSIAQLKLTIAYIHGYKKSSRQKSAATYETLQPRWKRTWDGSGARRGPAGRRTEAESASCERRKPEARNHQNKWR